MRIHLACFVFIMASCSANKEAFKEKGPDEAHMKQQRIIFIHGANFNARSWRPLIDSLKGVKTSAINLPGREDSAPFDKITLDYSAKALCSHLHKYSERLVVVAHSQGGAILNHALGKCVKKKDLEAIVYVAAVIPLPGEKPFELLSKKDEQNYFAGIEFVKNESSLKIKNKQDFLKAFAPEADEEARKLALQSAVSEPALIAEGKVSYELNKLKSIRKFYVHTRQDKIVSHESQKKTVSRLDFVKVYQLDSGHLPMLTKTQELATILQNVLKR